MTWRMLYTLLEEGFCETLIMAGGVCSILEWNKKSTTIKDDCRQLMNIDSLKSNTSVVNKGFEAKEYVIKD